MTIHGVIALITFVESWANTPSESIPEPGSEDKNDEDKEGKDEKSEEEGKSSESYLLNYIFLNDILRYSIIRLRSFFNSMHSIIGDNVYYSPSPIGKS